MKKRLYTFLTIVLLLSCITMGYQKGFTALPENEKQQKRTMIKRYLQINSTALDISDDDDYSSLAMLDKTGNDYDIYLAGETHTRFITGDISDPSHNGEIRLKLLKYFHRKHGVRYILQELGPDKAWIHNRYISTGDQSILDDLWHFRQYNQTPDPEKEEHYRSLQNLCRYNLSLPPGERLQIIGPDHVRPERVFFYAVNLLLSDKDLDAQLTRYREYARNRYSTITTDIDQIIENKTYHHDLVMEYWYKQANNKEDLKYIKAMYSQIVAGKSMYEEILGGDYFYLEVMLEKCLITSQTPLLQSTISTDQWYRERDTQTYDTFIKLYNHLPPGKIFGQWGTHHVYQKDYTFLSIKGEIDWFASLLDGPDSPFRNRVLSIRLFYSKPLEHGETLVNAFLHMAANSRITLYDLTDKHSPFTRESFMINEQDETRATTDYFQYAIYINYDIPVKQ
jgi:hypothetical protein